MARLADGWGGTLTQTVRTALADGAADAGLAGRQSLVGEKFQKAGEYQVRAAGVTYEEGEGEPLTPDSGLLMLREECAVNVCVQAGEDAAPLNLMAAAQLACRAVLRGGWIDPRLEFLEPAYAPEAEKDLLAEGGFIVSGRASVSFNIRGEL